VGSYDNHTRLIHVPRISREWWKHRIISAVWCLPTFFCESCQWQPHLLKSSNVNAASWLQTIGW
jgi:hypothetical protein